MIGALNYEKGLQPAYRHVGREHYCTDAHGNCGDGDRSLPAAYAPPRV